MPIKHVVEAGDTMVSIAHRYGFREWRTIYEHSANADLRRARPDPDVLQPGDSVVVPDKQPRVHVCATERRHRFKLKPLTAAFRLVVRDDMGVPMAGKKYKLEVEGQTIEDRLPGDARIERAVKPTTKKAKLTVWPDDDDKEYEIVWELAIGHLDPVDQVRGWKARLANLGYGVDPGSDAVDDATVQALKQFQAQVGVPVTGSADEATLQKLKLVHGA